MKNTFVFSFGILLWVCDGMLQGVAPYTQEGEASYYSNALHGRQTASGEVYLKELFTAAHKTLPFGTQVKVTNRHNDRSVIVKINDRGPFISGRIIDLSWAAAKKLNFISKGKICVEMEVVKAAAGYNLSDSIAHSQ